MAVPVAVCGQHSKLNCQRLKKPVTELLELKALTPPSQTCNGIPALRDSITVDNISNEVGSVKNVSSLFFVFLSTPVYLRSCGFG